MRTALVVVFVCLASLASAAPARRAVVILPPQVPADAEGLAFVMQSRASTLLVATGGYHDLHAKQILSVAGRERMAPGAMAAADGASLLARRLGAERVVFGRLARHGAGWTLRASVVTDAGKDAGASPITVQLPGSASRAVEEGALALARLAAAPDKVTVPPARAPLTTSDKAMASYLACYATIIRQSIVVEAPVVIEAAPLEKAVAACRAAVAADPKLMSARATLGLALALEGKDDEAVQALAEVKEGDGYLPFYWLGRYWLVTRYQSRDAGATALKKAIEKHPYFLLAYGYLAEHEHALHHDKAALEAWQAYREQLPKNNFIRGRISRSLARMGKHKEALAEARAAQADAKGDSEASLELASRHIDAGEPAEAITILEPLAEGPSARAELLLRLGYAYQLSGDMAAAEKMLRRAETGGGAPALRLAHPGARPRRPRAAARADRTRPRGQRHPGVDQARRHGPVPRGAERPQADGDARARRGRVQGPQGREDALLAPDRGQPVPRRRSGAAHQRGQPAPRAEDVRGVAVLERPRWPA
jgi:Flp pilus assembly protein TadD